MDDPVSWIPLIIWTLIFLGPLYRLLERTGLSLGWTFLGLIPIGGGLVLLYMIAFSKWPAVREIDTDAV
jgi:hypothetical protein